VVGLPGPRAEIEPVELASVSEPDVCRAVRAAAIDQAPACRAVVAAEPQLAVFGVLEHIAVCRRPEPGRAAERAVLARAPVTDQAFHAPAPAKELDGPATVIPAGVSRRRAARSVRPQPGLIDAHGRTIPGGRDVAPGRHGMVRPRPARPRGPTRKASHVVSR